MAIQNFSQLKTHIGSIVRDSQIGSTIGDFLNLTLQEIHTQVPGTWIRRKTTFPTVADQESYNLDEEVDRIAILRDITSPRKLIYLPDPLFYKYVPNPENIGSGTSGVYRLWEETGFSTQNTSAEKLTVVSSSTSDTSTFTVVIVGRESTNNLQVAEVVTLNGTTAVTTSTTFAIGGLLQVSKSAVTTGTITIAGNTSATTFSKVAPAEIAPRFKRLSLYPIPSAVITLYLEYYERLRLLTNDADVPQMDHQWNWLLREGALAKTWEYKQNETAATRHYAIYRDGLKRLERQDQSNLDYVPSLEPRMTRSDSVVRRYADSVSNNYPVYGVGY